MDGSSFCKSGVRLMLCFSKYSCTIAFMCVPSTNMAAPRVPIWEPSAFFISCFLIARSTVSRALLQCTDHSHCFSTSFSFLIKLVKKPGTKVTNLRKLGIPADKAYQWGNSRLGYWRIADSPDLKCSITNERLAAAGYFSILNYYESLHLCG